MDSTVEKGGGEGDEKRNKRWSIAKRTISTRERPKKGELEGKSLGPRLRGEDEMDIQAKWGRKKGRQRTDVLVTLYDPQRGFQIGGDYVGKTIAELLRTSELNSLHPDTS